MNILALWIGILVIILIIMWPAIISQAGFWPTSIKNSRKMLKIAKLKKNEKFYDLGCGEGRLVRMAENEFGARAVGIEFNPFIFAIAKILTSIYSKNAEIKFGDYRDYNWKDADVIAVYLHPKPMRELETMIKGLKKGTRIVSHHHKFEKLKPIKSLENEKIYLYRII